MSKEWALRIDPMFVGVFLSAAIYPVIGGLIDPAHSDSGDTIIMGLYIALGIFLLTALRNPSAHGSLIAFAAWSSFAHAMVMSALELEMASERAGFLVSSGVLLAIGAALIALAPVRQQVAPASAL